MNSPMVLDRTLSTWGTTQFDSPPTFLIGCKKYIQDPYLNWISFLRMELVFLKDIFLLIFLDGIWYRMNEFNQSIMQIYEDRRAS